MTSGTDLTTGGSTDPDGVRGNGGKLDDRWPGQSGLEQAPRLPELLTE